ncbi:YjbH domain-containing protein [Luteimonas sp. BDR2-5]|uniref:YjbH domain-containing protein n=1 Tax=Proluteimonas luteida TaxID=2878685 RepID=UPI001E285C1C|nr:YjbH domain-containing protein [Luteimonas sp. BDR2-5]MCD9028701.1 YjbH domain-containing protein [Luteimonas sp. BDR2-5]
MIRTRPRPPRRLALCALGLAVSGSLHAQDMVTQSDWGGAGLLQTPTARMEPEGQISLTGSYTSPYARYNLSMQPFPWLEGSFRYMSINNRRYGRPELSGDQKFKDKSLDFKIRLWEESHRLPEIAFGMRDVGGTGLFSSEYLVANKRFGNFDVSLGLATGYIGNRGDIANPLRLIDDRFETRPIPFPDITQAGRRGGDIFRGPIGVFGGVSWQTPLEQLLVKVELDGNDYEREPQGNNQVQDAPINIGLVYRPRPGIELTAGIERGNTAVFGLSLNGNLKNARSNAPLLDRPAPALARHANAVPASPANADDDTESPGTQAAVIDWSGIADQLQSEAGIGVSRITRRDRELIVHGSQNRYFFGAQGVGRGSRVLDNALPGDDSIEWFTFAHERVGMPIAETSVERQAFADYVERRIDLDTLARKVELNPPAQQHREEVYRAPLERFQYGIGPGYQQVMGGPDAFILYQFSANLHANWRFSRHTWLDGTVSYDLLNNFDKFRYDAPTNLPRVRTWQRQYLTTSKLTVPTLQLTTAHQLGRDWYGMAYAGYLESMYGGVGGEVLYRPFGERWAVGLDVNQVRQRNFNQRAGFRDYEITTGHVTGYFTFGREQRVQALVSAGKYLAGDIGATVNVARRFDNGVTMGAWATKTNISSATFGEGSFDKGIYFSVPMDFLLPRPTRARANIVWQPLFRDGGAKLVRRYSLYSLLGERDGEFLFDNLDWIDR